ncbi:hypothetical protein AVDCRST_MAG92-740 [uncultured Coleofasciculus sp.]|uniref:Uncharacterized protein n=1 Tax=uncultured Coleofasciculus sp. TaxID=1267456 RepID=A0A6J4HGW2_9CYAN|nr:hypothetical protein AVDCRST_MAG92-740 [uncultured Coleofasciculus sp.]
MSIKKPQAESWQDWQYLPNRILGFSVFLFLTKLITHD